MQTSQQGIDLIKRFEGCRLEAYKCPRGVWTIGYGHTKGVQQRQKITQIRADELLKQDLKVFENQVNNNVFIPLNQNQFDALVSFTYNCGVGNLRTLVRNRNTNQIAEALLLYNKAGGKILTGLTKRRTAERALFIK